MAAFFTAPVFNRFLSSFVDLSYVFCPYCTDKDLRSLLGCLIPEIYFLLFEITGKFGLSHVTHHQLHKYQALSGLDLNPWIC